MADIVERLAPVWVQAARVLGATDAVILEIGTLHPRSRRACARTLVARLPTVDTKALGRLPAVVEQLTPPTYRQATAAPAAPPPPPRASAPGLRP